jgi:predicted ATPase
LIASNVRRFLICPSVCASGSSPSTIPSRPEKVRQRIFEAAVEHRDLACDLLSSLSLIVGEGNLEIIALERNGEVKLAKPIALLRIPPTVQGILASRIDRLPADEKDLLQTVAVIGT